MKCMWGILDLMGTRKLNQPVWKICSREIQFRAERDTELWDTEKDTKGKAARLQESILRTHTNISLQMEIHKSTLKYAPFNFSPSVLENCEQIYIDGV